MGGNPIRHRLVADTQHAPNPPEVDPVHVQLDRLLAHLRRVANGVGSRRILALTQFAEVTLAP